VKNYRLFLAYSRSGVFTSPGDERQYEDAWQELVTNIHESCSDVYAYVNSKRWRDARDRNNSLLDVIPPNLCKEDPEVRKMVKNFLAWEEYIARKIHEASDD
jgi:hypothetical protein